MSEPSRTRRFDGFERPAAPSLAVPESGLDRILEALTRSRAYVPQAIEQKLSELWDADTALAFAVLLAVWAGLQFTPAGWVADLLAAAYGVASLGAELLQLVEAGQHAATAQTDVELDAAARELAQALTESAAEIIAAILGGILFARLRRLVRLARVKLLPRRFGRSPETALTLGDRLIGAPGRRGRADRESGARPEEKGAGAHRRPAGVGSGAGGRHAPCGRAGRHLTKGERRMSTQALLRSKPEGRIPTAFEVIRNAGRPDWQTAVPASAEERKWYTVGYAMKEDYEINQPVSPTLPPAFRLWWALGLVDAKSGSAPRALWRKDEPPQEPGTSWGPLAVGGAVAGAVGVALLLAAARRGTP